MSLKNLLITILWLVIPVTVLASGRLCGSESAVVENWKGEYIQADELISTLEEPEEMTVAPEESISTLEYEPDLIFDEPDLIVDETEE